MTLTFRGACRTLLPLSVLIGAATMHAQTTTPSTKADSVAAAAKSDSAAHAQPQKKHGFFSRMKDVASHASNVVQEKTGINPANALQGAALLAAKANPAMAMMQAMQAAQQLQAGQAAQMASGAAMGNRGAGLASIGMGMAGGAAQMQVMQRLQKMMGGGGGGGAAAAAAAGAQQNAELSALQLQMAQIATAASKGDQSSMAQLMRFQGEMAMAMMRLNTLAPAAQQAALPAVMRAAIACATTGQGCSAGTK